MFKFRRKQNKNVELADHNHVSLSIAALTSFSDNSDVHSLEVGVQPVSYKHRKMLLLMREAKWDEVRIKLNSSNGKDWSRVVDESGLSLLGMALGLTSA